MSFSVTLIAASLSPCTSHGSLLSTSFSVLKAQGRSQASVGLTRVPRASSQWALSPGPFAATSLFWTELSLIATANHLGPDFLCYFSIRTPNATEKVSASKTQRGAGVGGGAERQEGWWK